MITPWWGLESSSHLRHARSILSAAGPLEAGVALGRTPTDHLLAAHLRERKGAMGSKDRALLGLAVFGLARNRALILKAAGEGSGPGQLLGLALADAIEGRDNPLAEEYSAGLDALDRLRREALEIVEGSLQIPVRELSESERGAFCDLFSVEEFWLDLGPWPVLGDAAAELNVGKFQQKPQLRVEGGQAGRERALEGLAALDVAASPMVRSPWGIALECRVKSGALNDFQVEFQDEGSQLAALLCLPLERGQRVLDLCAGGGGKALALASNSPATIFIHDTDRRRLAKALPRIAKAGHNKIKPLDDPESRAPYDLVLVDAPCSSTGTLRRNPAISSRWTRGEALAFSSLQAGILDRAAGMVRPGGSLVYVTCSLFAGENEHVAEGFLADHRDFSATTADHPAFADIPGTISGAFRLPLNLAGYGGDGFFCARFLRA